MKGIRNEWCTLGSEEMNSCILAFLAASIISAIGTSRELSPYAMFSAILQSNSTGSWDTIPICLRSHWTFRSFTRILSRIYNWKYKKNPFNELVLWWYTYTQVNKLFYYYIYKFIFNTILFTGKHIQIKFNITLKKTLKANKYSYHITGLWVVKPL